MAAGTMYPLSLSDLKAFVPGVNPNDLYYLTDSGREGEFLLEATYNVPSQTPPAADDAITVNSNTLSGKVYRYRRVIEEGYISVRWFGAVGDGTTDDSTAIQNAVDTAEGINIIFDAPGDADYFIDTATITVPQGITLRFRAGNKITGTGTIDGGIIDAGYDQQIFTTSLTIIPEGLVTEMFSVKWFGAVGSGSHNDHPAIQKSIDTLVPICQRLSKIYFPGGNYLIDNPILLHYFTSGSYHGFTIQLIGDSVFWAASAAGSRIICSFKDTFAIGIQGGKGVSIKGLYISGAFTPPTLTAEEFYMIDFDEYRDNTDSCQDSVNSPYSGIVIDPFSNSALNIPPDGGYPGLTAYYQGAGGNGGSTGITIDNCFINNFVVGICSSPNSFTRNAENTLISNTQFQFCKLCISSSQDQEKTCKVYRSACWANSHTFFASGKYGAGTPGQWELDGVQLAGRINTFVDHQSGGYFPSYIKYCFSESLGKFGRWTSEVASRVENCEFGFANMGEAGFYNSPHIISSASVSFENCNIRIYGSNYPVTLVGGGLYKNCAFETVPYIGLAPNFISSPTPPYFTDCLAAAHALNPSTDLNMPSGLQQQPTYGSFQIYRADTLSTSVKEKFIVENFQPNLVAVASSQVTTAITDHEFTFTADTNDMYIYETGRLVVAVIDDILQPMGIITDVDTGSRDITVSFTAKLIEDSTAYTIGVVYPITFCVPFLGDVTANGNEIQNVVAELDSESLNVNQWIKSHDFVTNTYNPYVKILAYNSMTRTYTVSSNSFYTKEGEYFTNGAGKEIILESANSSLLNNMLLPVGTKISQNSQENHAKYVVTKAGFVNADAVGDTRQAIWRMLKPYTALTYKVITDSDYDVSFEDELLDVDATAGDIEINLRNSISRVAPGNGGARLIRIKKVDSSGNVVNINKNTEFADQPIDGQSVITLSSQYDSVTIYQGVSEYGTPGYIQNTGIIK